MKPTELKNYNKALVLLADLYNFNEKYITNKFYNCYTYVNNINSYGNMFLVYKDLESDELLNQIKEFNNNSYYITHIPYKNYSIFSFYTDNKEQTESFKENGRMFYTWQSIENLSKIWKNHLNEFYDILNVYTFNFEPLKTNREKQKYLSLFLLVLF